MFLEDFIGFIKFIFVILISSLLIFSIAVGVTVAYESYVCNVHEEITGVPTKYAGFTCYINYTERSK